MAGVASSGSIAAGLAYFLKEPYRTLISSVIPVIALTFYKYQPELEEWVVAKVRTSNAKREARGACKGITKLIAIYKGRLAEPDLDPSARDEISAEVVKLQKSLTEKQREASLGR